MLEQNALSLQEALRAFPIKINVKESELETEGSPVYHAQVFYHVDEEIDVQDSGTCLVATIDGSAVATLTLQKGDAEQNVSTKVFLNPFLKSGENDLWITTDVITFSSAFDYRKMTASIELTIDGQTTVKKDYVAPVPTHPFLPSVSKVSDKLTFKF